MTQYVKYKVYATVNENRKRINEFLDKNGPEHKRWLRQDPEAVEELALLHQALADAGQVSLSTPSPEESEDWTEFSREGKP